MKILLLDIETSPNTGYFWKIWQENISPKQLIESSTVLCYTAKWLGDETVHFDSIYKSAPKAMLKRVHRLLDLADGVVTYNGTSFDLPVLNKEFIIKGFMPPAPYKSIDLYRVVKKQFRFVSNRLDYVCKMLGIGEKKEVDFELWARCLKKDPEAWAKMEDYNIHDVYLLEELYQRVKPWLKTHPNHSIHSGLLVCPICGSDRYQSRGTASSAAGIYARYQCKDCGKWFRGNHTKAAKDKFIAL